MHSLIRNVALSAFLAAAVAVVAPVSVAAAQDGETLTLPVRRPGALPALITDERIQKDLSLTRQQKDQVNDLRLRHRDAVRKAVKGVDYQSDASKASAQRSIDAITASYNAQLLRVLNATQRERLVQIERQVLGGFHLLDAGVRDELQLTNAQKARLARILQRHRTNVANINGWYESGEIGNYERILYLRQDRERRGNEMRRLLTREQRTAFDAMAGDPLAI